MDGRKNTADELLARRLKAIRLHGEGLGATEIARRTGLSRSAVHRAIQLMATGGEEALRPRSRGRQAGSGRVLSPEQEAAVCRAMCRRPRHHGLGRMLWTRQLVQELIERTTGVSLSVRATNEYLGRWGVGVADRLRSQPDGCTAKVAQWLKAHGAELRDLAAREDAVVYLGHKRRRLTASEWSSRPSTPVEQPELDGVDDLDNECLDGDLEASALEPSAIPTRKLFLASATDPQGTKLWAVFAGPAGREQDRKFLNALVAETRKPRILLVRADPRDFSHADVREWLMANNSAPRGSGRRRAKVTVLPQTPGDAQGRELPMLLA